MCVRNVDKFVTQHIAQSALYVYLISSYICSLTLREGHRLGAFENGVLRGDFEQKRDNVTGGWKKLHNDELRNMYSLPSVSD
jgi:hypothetical protein